MENKYLTLNKLSKKELLNLKEILTFLLKTHYINIIDKKELINNSITTSLCVVVRPSNFHNLNKNKEDLFMQLTGKAIYSTLFNNLNSSNIRKFLKDFLFDDFKIIRVKRIVEDVIRIEHGHKEYVELDQSKLKEFFIQNPNFIQNEKYVLFIFDKINWEMAQIIFKNINYRINGGSHTKRYLISPLDIKLIEVTNQLKDYLYTLSEEEKISVEEREILNLNKKKFLYKEILNSYYLHVKIRSNYLNPILNKYKEYLFTLNPSISSHLILEYYFYQEFNIVFTTSRDILVVLNKQAEERLNKEMELVLNLINNLLPIKNMTSSKSNYLKSLDLGKRSYSSIAVIKNQYPDLLEKKLQKRSLVMQDFLLNIKSKLDSISNPVEAQLFVENYWTEQMREFLREDKNLVQRHGSNVNKQIYRDLDKHTNIIKQNNELKQTKYHDVLFKKYKNFGHLIDYTEAIMIAYFIGVDCVTKGIFHTHT